MTKQITVRIPDELDAFIREQAEATSQDRTAVVVASLLAMKRSSEIAEERALLSKIGGDPYPDLLPSSTDETTQVWKDLEW